MLRLDFTNELWAGHGEQKYLCKCLYTAAQGRMRGWWREPGKDAVLSGQCAEGPGLDFWNPLRTGERVRTASSERCMQQAHTIFPASLSALVDFPRLVQEPGKEPLLTGISHLPGPCSHLSFTRKGCPLEGWGDLAQSRTAGKSRVWIQRQVPVSLLLFSLQDIMGPLQLSQGVTMVTMPGEGAQGGCREEEMSGLSRWSRLGGGWQVPVLGAQAGEKWAGPSSGRGGQG